MYRDNSLLYLKTLAGYMDYNMKEFNMKEFVWGLAQADHHLVCKKKGTHFPFSSTTCII